MSIPEKIALVFAILTLPAALVFIWRYARDPWWRTMFGVSLMLIAVAVLLYSLASIAFRIWGPDYIGRPVLLPAASGMTFVAMTLRTVVLWRLQRADRSPL